MRHYSFKPAGVAVVGIALALPLFCSLGVWQLNRAAEKRALQAQLASQSGEPPLRLDAPNADIEPPRYRRVAVKGEYDAGRQFLLDNQIHGGKAGYHVLTPLRLEAADLAVLVNRGWIPAGPDRRRLPDLPIQMSAVELTGVVERFPAVGLKLEGAEVPAPGWPATVQVPEREALERRLGYRLLPYQVLLDQGAAEGYARDWKPANVDPDKSTGYAFQWFSFAAIALGLFLRHGFRAGAAQDPDVCR
ncbi:SURF1 family protein [Methylococcus mesophilus]|uniref:SURF1 family protein n=1 Tax=Methylococcus mesophilus TaxID=2993564 RepID=UPI00224AA73C|nr:SURF1 family protein [Methylococcus mesophilus]UZR27424.1 SURF1 family protein [Methylococcus mesophilus]